MAQIFSIRPSEHDSVQKLLPWFVNGTLEPKEKERVETHLDECTECRDDLAFERTLARDVASLHLDADSGWQIVRQRIESPRHPALSPARFARRQVPMGWAVAGSLAASLSVAAVMTTLKPSPPPDQTFHTLGASLPAADGQVVVLFRPDTTQDEMRVILAAQGARIADGPTSAGAYILHVERGSPATAVTNLRQSTKVVLAEPLTNDGRP